MDLPELDKAQKIEADAQATAVAAKSRWKAWFTTNHDEAVSIACVAAAVGLIVGAIFWYVVG
jgi:hypothetical protein